MADPEYWTAEKVASYLGVTNSTVRAFVATKRLPPPAQRYGVTKLRKPATMCKSNASRPRGGTSR